jgi:hypothetical protein
MPQPDVKVDAEGTIQIKVAPHFDSNEMVMEMMLMAGEAVSQVCIPMSLPPCSLSLRLSGRQALLVSLSLSFFLCLCFRLSVSLRFSLCLSNV